MKIGPIFISLKLHIQYCHNEYDSTYFGIQAKPLYFYFALFTNRHQWSLRLELALNVIWNFCQNALLLYSPRNNRFTMINSSFTIMAWKYNLDSITKNGLWLFLSVNFNREKIKFSIICLQIYHSFERRNYLQKLFT